MKLPLTTLLAALAALHGSIATSSLDKVLFEKLDSLPQGWTQGPPVLAHLPIRFRIAVKQQKAAAFEQHVIDISTPGHEKYGQHMSREELKRSLRPSDAARGAILSWLEDEGVEDVEDDGDWINFTVVATEAERILDTRFYYYDNERTGANIARTLSYSVPETVKPYVQMIQPTTRFGQINPQRSTAFRVGGARSIFEDKAVVRSSLSSSAKDAGPSSCAGTLVTPQCLRDLYQIGNYTDEPGYGNRLGISGYLEEYPKYADLETFLHKYAPGQDPAKNNFTFEFIGTPPSVNTQTDTKDDDVEANLDVQFAMSLGYEVETVYYSTSGRAPLIPDLDQPGNVSSNEPYLDQLHYLLSLPDDELPTTLSTSYGEDEQSVPASYTNATCSLFAQLGARGVSVLFSSGDTGVGSACLTNDGKNTTRFLPTFPAACPFVTSVGGTFHTNPERAVSFSSGGFSDRFARPAYQDGAVKNYLAKLGDKWQGLYNPSGRGFPDVAAQALNFSVVDKGETIPVGGTSASAPTFAGVVSLLNGARLARGLKPLGFLNPWIYSEVAQQGGLTDIVDGGSRGCTGKDQYSGLPTPFVPGASWNATEGWDPVTGYGTPVFPRLLKLALEKKDGGNKTSTTHGA